MELVQSQPAGSHHERQNRPFPPDLCPMAPPRIARRRDVRHTSNFRSPKAHPVCQGRTPHEYPRKLRLLLEHLRETRPLRKRRLLTMACLVQSVRRAQTQASQCHHRQVTENLILCSPSSPILGQTVISPIASVSVLHMLPPEAKEHTSPAMVFKDRQVTREGVLLRGMIWIRALETLHTLDLRRRLRTDNIIPQAPR